MEKFELSPSDYPIGKRVRKELSLLGLLVLILFFFVGLNVVYFTSVFFMYILLLLLKRNRIIIKLKFDNKNKKLILSYYYLIFLKGKEHIPYSKLISKLSMKRFGFGAATETLEIFKGKILSGEIRKDGKWKWPKEQIRLISEKLSEIDKNNSY